LYGLWDSLTAIPHFTRRRCITSLVAELRQLHSIPSDASSPLLQVFEGDITTEQEQTLKPLIYAIVLGLPDAVEYTMLSGVQVIRDTVDVVLLEHSRDGKTRPHKKDMTELRHQILRKAPKVKYLAPGIPFLTRLKYLSGTRPRGHYEDSLTLTSTLRFRGRWAMKVSD
jgi:hypothetical protein